MSWRVEDVEIHDLSRNEIGSGRVGWHQVGPRAAVPILLFRLVDDTCLIYTAGKYPILNRPQNIDFPIIASGSC